MSYYENRKTEDMPETVNHNSLTDTVRYIRSDIAAERETKIIQAAFYTGITAQLDHIRNAEPPTFCPESDVELAYCRAGLEKLK